jgi:hypothetical protein
MVAAKKRQTHLYQKDTLWVESHLDLHSSKKNSLHIDYKNTPTPTYRGDSSYSIRKSLSPCSYKKHPSGPGGNGVSPPPSLYPRPSSSQQPSKKYSAQNEKYSLFLVPEGSSLNDENSNNNCNSDGCDDNDHDSKNNGSYSDRIKEKHENILVSLKEMRNRRK